MLYRVSLGLSGCPTFNDRRGGRTFTPPVYFPYTANILTGQYSIHLTDERIVAALKRLAEGDQRTLKAYVNRVLTEHVDRQNGNARPTPESEVRRVIANARDRKERKAGRKVKGANLTPVVVRAQVESDPHLILVTCQREHCGHLERQHTDGGRCQAMSCVCRQFKSAKEA